MTIPFWCLLVAVLIPYVLAGVTGRFRMQQFGGIDNENPRVQQTRLEGVGSRAQAAQDNAREALPVFIAAVLVSHAAGVEAATAAWLSIVFVLARIGHAVCYLGNWATPRSLMFLVGIVCCLSLFGAAARV